MNNFDLHQFLAFVRAMDMPHLLVFLFFSALILVVTAAILQFLYAMIFLPDPRIALRGAAYKLGFTIEKVERDMPSIYPDGSVKIEKGKCMKYTMPQQARHGGDWSLLQRFPETPQLPNGYVVEPGDAPPALLAKLKSLARHFSSDFYEFERRGDTLVVYWDEYGDEAQLRKIYKMLSDLEDA